MTELTRIRLRTLVWLFLIPIPLIGILPAWLHHHLEGRFTWAPTLGQWLGVWLILNGLGLAGWCVTLFNVRGRGTPLPHDPPKHFVAEGPYRWTRNPMFLSVFLLVAGEGLLYQSSVLLLYLLLVISVAHLFVVLVEEPDLRRRFGAAYDAYHRQVPRWIPKSPKKQYNKRLDHKESWCR